MLLENNPNIDLYRLLRTGGSEESFALPDAYRRVDQCLAVVRKLEQQGRLKIDQTLKDKDTVAVVSEALAHLGSYHHRPALKRRGDRLFHVDRNLLLFYQNRFEGFDARELERRP